MPSKRWLFGLHVGWRHAPGEGCRVLLSEGFEADLAATGVAFGAFDDLAPLLLAIRIGGLVVPSPLARKPFPAMLLLSPLFEALALAPPGPFPVVFRLFLGAAT